MPSTGLCPASHRERRYHLIFLHSVPDRPLSSRVIGLHAAHLAGLDGCGKLVLAGPLIERAGRLIVLRTGSAAEAMAIAEEDPLVREAYQTYELATWLMCNNQNGYCPDVRSGLEK